MGNRNVVTASLVVDGKPLTVSFLDNIIIDDVLITEAMIQAQAIQNQDGSADNRQVEREIRYYLIRLGVER
jgi:hypothetical protein